MYCKLLITKYMFTYLIDSQRKLCSFICFLEGQLMISTLMCRKVVDGFFQIWKWPSTVLKIDFLYKKSMFPLK